jgi:hypothetical protein
VAQVLRDATISGLAQQAAARKPNPLVAAPKWN